MNRFTGLVRRCVEDYDMIQDGEAVAVGLSGGKDSVALLCALANLRRYFPKRFTLHAVTLDPGFEGMDFQPVEALCAELAVPLAIRRTDMGRIIFEDRQEKNPCALCAKMRRGALNEMVTALGIKKLAFAHHHDDAVETFLLSLLYEGRIACFQPVTYMSRTDVTQIRPMLYASEQSVKNLIVREKLPVVHNPCPQNGKSKREEIKQLIQTLSVAYPDVKTKVFNAMQRYPLPGWEAEGLARRPLP